MKIAILTSGILPSPAVQGGAVENLVDFYLEYNNRHRLHDITVYSVESAQAYNHPALLSEVNHYKFIDINSLKAKIRRKLYEVRHKHDYYNHFIEYYFEEAWKLLCKEKYDCIILENRPGYALKISQRTSTPIVLHLHNDLLNATIPHNKDIYRSLSRILTVSDYIKGRVETIAPHPKVQTVYNGIDLERFSPQTNEVIERSTLGLRPDDFVLVFSGRINSDKGTSELIEAMLLLIDHPHLKLLVLGSSFFGDATTDNDFVRKLKQMALPIKDRLIFTGFIPYDKMPGYLKLADLAVIPSIWNDPFPTTVLEAQAMGLPIVTTDRGGIPEEVTAENAIIVPIGNDFPARLASVILQLSEQPAQCKAMATASLIQAEKFDKQRFSEDFFNALKDLNA